MLTLVRQKISSVTTASLREASERHMPAEPENGGTKPAVELKAFSAHGIPE